TTSSTDKRCLTASAEKTIAEIELALTCKYVNRIDLSVGIVKCHVEYCVNGMISGKINCIFWNGYFYLSDPGKQLQDFIKLFADIIIKGCRPCYEILGHDPVT
ncbi:hypothetical protein IHE44_0004839, partial [Lamprotornis superbus]